MTDTCIYSFENTLNFKDVFVYFQICHSSLKTYTINSKRERYRKVENQRHIVANQKILLMFSSEINWFSFYKDKALKSQCRSPLMK